MQQLQPSLFASLGRNWQLVADAAVDAMLNAAAGGVIIRAPDGRELTRISVKDAQSLYDFAIQQIASANNPGDGGIILAEFAESQSQNPRRSGFGW